MVIASILMTQGFSRLSVVAEKVQLMIYADSQWMRVSKTVYLY